MNFCHVITAAAWMAAQSDGEIAPGAEGFLHCCTPAQLEFVLSRHFSDTTGLVILRFTPPGEDVRWVQSEPGLAPFPHLHAALNCAWVSRIDAL